MSFAPLKRFLPRRAVSRLALLYSLLIAVTVLFMFFFTLLRVRHQFYKELKGFILEEAKEIRAILIAMDSDVRNLKIPFDHMFTSWKENIIGVYVKKEGGPVLYQSRDLVSADLVEGLKFVPIDELQNKHILPARFPGRRHMGQLLPFSFSNGKDTNFLCVVAVYPRNIVKNISNLKYGLIVLMVFFLVFSSLVGIFVARRAYLPIKNMVAVAKKIDEKNLNLRLKKTGTGDELDLLAETFNNLFDRLFQTFQREREFTAQVAHELRTPLTALRGAIEMTLLKDTLPPVHREELANAIEATDSLITLVNSLLFLSRAQSGLKTNLSLSKSNIGALVNKAIEITIPEQEERDSCLTVHVPETLEWEVDPNLMLHLIVNLVDNAKRHTPVGTPITIRAFQEAKALYLRVEDKGPGISHEYRERIFDKFFTQIQENAEIKDRGAGLGLSIARIIAQLHSGELTYDENPGGGSVFICRISSP